METLGKSTVDALVGRKILQVDVLASREIPTSGLHHFSKAFWLTNYAYREKSHLDKEIKDETDPRNFRHTKTVDSMSLAHDNPP